jgi:hypothetical protein
VINLFINGENSKDTMGIMLIRLSTEPKEVDICRKIFFFFYKTFTTVENTDYLFEEEMKCGRILLNN